MANTKILTQLKELAANLMWVWTPATLAIFRDIDPALWRAVNHNPVAFLEELSPEQLSQRAADLALEARISYAFHRLRDYLAARNTWGDFYAGPLKSNPVAYFSAEFGLHESIPIYSGGLGTLAGDHIKTASDLGVPLVGIGLCYAQGYFRQQLDATGRQQEFYRVTEMNRLPIQRVLDNAGQPMRVHVETRGGRIAIGLWRAQVGRSLLLLLDSEVEENAAADREITGRLYGGDHRLRIAQELILGVGGMRVLAALSIRPAVLHLNEGHSAFAVLEMARQEMAADAIPFAEALHRVTARTVFTTHTPVDAGHDRFDNGLVDQYLGPLREQLGLSHDGLMGLGRVNVQDGNEPFCMTVLGLKTARKSNAVSALHGRISRRMWRPLWPNRPEDEIPIGHVTNAVHVSTWIAPAMRQLFDNYLRPDWEHRMCAPETWNPIDSIPDGELWEALEITKARLVSYVTRQVCAQETARGGGPDVCDITKKRLDPSILTIGFARRFATYKRGDLISRDEQRLERLITDPKRPIQIIFAGKAHPKDEPGKQRIQRIFEMSHDSRFMGRVVFLEDYDMNVARHLIQGVDLWLNTPRRPLEASGTSGMKAIFNGVLNLSILDGWWAEAYDGSNGFAIGTGGQHADPEEQDRRDAEALYSVLEKQAIPLFYTRDENALPKEWIARIKHAIRSLAWRFNANRMLTQYVDEYYLPMVVGRAP